jgi:hypothetical protein
MVPISSSHIAYASRLTPEPKLGHNVVIDWLGPILSRIVSTNEVVSPPRYKATVYSVTGPSTGCCDQHAMKYHLLSTLLLKSGLIRRVLSMRTPETTKQCSQQSRACAQNRLPGRWLFASGSREDGIDVLTAVGDQCATTMTEIAPAVLRPRKLHGAARSHQ